MNQKSIDRLLAFKRDGCRFKLYSGPYVDDFAVIEDSSLGPCIHNNVQITRLLSEVPASDVQVFKEIEWYE